MMSFGWKKTASRRLRGEIANVKVPRGTPDELDSLDAIFPPSNKSQKWGKEEYLRPGDVSG